MSLCKYTVDVNVSDSSSQLSRFGIIAHESKCGINFLQVTNRMREKKNSLALLGKKRSKQKTMV